MRWLLRFMIVSSYYQVTHYLLQVIDQRFCNPVVQAPDVGTSAFDLIRPGPNLEQGVMYLMVYFRITCSRCTVGLALPEFLQ